VSAVRPPVGAAVCAPIAADVAASAVVPSAVVP